jgi:anti-sigma factor RsiW
MSMQDYDHELVQRYLEGGLSEEEKHALEERLKTETALQEALALYRDIDEKLGDTQEYRDFLSEDVRREGG